MCSLTKKENFHEWLVQWGEEYAYVYAKKRRLEYGNTPEGMRWLALWSALYIQPYFERKEEERQKKDKERQRLAKERERERYLRGHGSTRKNGVGGRRRFIIDPLDERLSDKERLIVEKEYLEMKAKTIAEQELAANRWLREWRIENGIKRRWEYKDNGYESMEDEL